MIRLLGTTTTTNYLKIGRILWTWIVPGVVLCVIWTRLIHGPGQDQLFSGQLEFDWFWLLLCLMLLPMNISLEAAKWLAVLGANHNPSLGASIKIILRGRSLNLISPFGLGDAFVKCISLENFSKKQLLGGVLFERMAQMIPMLVMGVSSVGFMIRNGFEFTIPPVWLLASVLILILTFRWLLIAYSKTFHEYFVLLDQMSIGQKLKILAISTVRYAVFTLQFLCVFWWLKIDELWWLLLFGISWIFLIKSIVPNLSVFGDLISRQLSTYIYFTLFMIDIEPVMLASFVIWVINIILPAGMGVFFISDLKKTL